MVFAIATLLVAVGEPHAAYLAADSRASQRAIRADDVAYKIAFCGQKALCGISGNLTLGAERDGKSGSFDLLNAISAARTPLNTPPDRESALIANHVKEELERFVARWLKTLAGPFPTDPKAGQTVATMMYLYRAPSGRITLIETRLPFEQQQNVNRTWALTILPPSPKTLASDHVVAQNTKAVVTQGTTECVPNAGQILREGGTPSTIEAIQNAFRRLAPLPHCKELIGGPVDIAVIDASGRRWIQRK